LHANLHVAYIAPILRDFGMILQKYDQKTTDLVNALESIAVLADIAKRSPEMLILAGLILLFIGILII